MAIIKINLTEDSLKLISNIHFEKVPSLKGAQYPMTWGIDYYSLYGGSYLFEDVSLILGRYDERIKDTEEDALGPRFKPEFEDYMTKLHEYIIDNLEYIEDLVHYYCNKGGLTAGTYKCISSAKNWEKITEGAE